jgi:hypothetical protein
VDLYPVVAKLIGGADPIGPVSRAHVEIRRLAGMLSRLIEELPEDGPTPADLRDLRRVLYGLRGVLRLHFAQEDESLPGLLHAGGGLPARGGTEPQARTDVYHGVAVVNGLDRSLCDTWR